MEILIRSVHRWREWATYRLAELDAATLEAGSAGTTTREHLEAMLRAEESAWRVFQPAFLIHRWAAESGIPVAVPEP